MFIRKKPAVFSGTVEGTPEITHYIYHVPGVKFGCTSRYESRRYNYPRKIRETISIHEELRNCTDWEAGDRERYWNELFGYLTGPHYGLTIKGNRKGGQTTAVRGAGGFQTMPQEKCKEVGQLITEMGVGIHKLNSAQKAEAGKKGRQRQAELGIGLYGITKASHEQQAARGRRSRELRKGIHGFTSEQRSVVSSQMHARKSAEQRSVFGKNSTLKAIASGKAAFLRKKTCFNCGREMALPNLSRHIVRCLREHGRTE